MRIASIPFKINSLKVEILLDIRISKWYNENVAEINFAYISFATEFF
jgi:hypothetical protein